MKKRMMSLLMVSVLAIGLTACGGGSKNEGTEQSQRSQEVKEDSVEGGQQAASGDLSYKIGFVNLSDNDENCYLATTTFIEMTENDEFKESIGLDDSAAIEVIALDSEMDMEKQTNHVENLLMQGCDMIFLIGADTEGNATNVEACNEEGVPIFMVATTASRGEYVFVGWDEYQYGVYQGNWAVDNFPENAKICYMDGTSGREAFEKREAGFKDIIAEKRPDCEIISTQASENTTAEEAMQITEDWITQYGDDITSIVTQSNLTTIGAVEALESAEMIDDVIVLGGVHLGTWDVDFLRDGSEDYAVYVGFDKLGELCSDIAKRWYKGEPIEEKEMIEFYDVTPDNVDEYFPK